MADIKLKLGVIISKMKKNILFIIILAYPLLFPTKAEAQVDSCYAGVYLNYDDFNKNNLSHKINLNQPKNRLEILLPNKTVKVTSISGSSRFKAGSIYAYYNCGDTYRYSPNVELLSPEDYYKILEMSATKSNKMIIYSSVFLGGDELFYSIGLSSKVHRLNIKNLEKDLIEKYPEFIKKAKVLNSTLDGLAKKDLSGKYLINKYYEQYIK